MSEERKAEISETNRGLGWEVTSILRGNETLSVLFPFGEGAREISKSEIIAENETS